MDRRALMRLTGSLIALAAMRVPTMAASSSVIDDLSRAAFSATNGSQWRFVSDGVMGGVSSGSITREVISGRRALRMKGAVRLENNGGFIQIALDLSPDGSAIDASAYTGIEIDVIGNGEPYSLHLRTNDLNRPWQSYRQAFKAQNKWNTVRLPFSGFEAYRTSAMLDLTKLRRIGIVAIGRAFEADLAIGGVRFYS